MINYSLLEIAKILNTEYILRSDEIINNIITDSRNITISEHTIFIALSGKMHNGHTFLNNLYDKGIRNFIVSEKKINIHSILNRLFFGGGIQIKIATKKVET